MSFLDDLEKKIDRRVRALFQDEKPSGGGREIVEIQRAILEDLESRIERLPRDRRIFPFNDVTARLAIPSVERRAAFELVFLRDQSLERDAAEHLRRLECEVPADFRLRVELVEDAAELAGQPLRILCRNREAAAESSAPGVPRVKLSVLEGDAARSEFSFAQARINLGRLPSVRTSGQRLVRRNDAAFDDRKEPPNSTVSRAHAHLEFDSSAGGFRLFDDGSRFGTSIVRDGEIVRVPAGAGPGLRLQSGDEIHLGSARLRFEIVPG
jgi:hypothetical protein